uniref:Uncharacterized protein n=1 Tax=Romanomermis culicivorax TaxID=13658 RepID=A0A915K9P1_ROMCU
WARRAASLFVIAVGQYPLLGGEVHDQAPAWVDFRMNTNLQGLGSGSYWKRPHLHNANFIIDGAQHVSKGIGHLCPRFGHRGQWLWLGNH